MPGESRRAPRTVATPKTQRAGRRPRFAHASTIEPAWTGSSRALFFRSLIDCGSSLKCGGSALVGRQHHQRRIVLQRAAGEGRDGVGQPRLERRRAARAMREQRPRADAPPRIPRRPSISRLGQAVGEQHEPIAGVDRDLRLFVVGVGESRRAPGRRCRAARPSRRRDQHRAGSVRRWCRSSVPVGASSTA